MLDVSKKTDKGMWPPHNTLSRGSVASSRTKTPSSFSMSCSCFGTKIVYRDRLRDRLTPPKREAKPASQSLARLDCSYSEARRGERRATLRHSGHSTLTDLHTAYHFASRKAFTRARTYTHSSKQSSSTLRAFRCSSLTKSLLANVALTLIVR